MRVLPLMLVLAFLAGCTSAAVTPTPAAHVAAFGASSALPSHLATLTVHKINEPVAEPSIGITKDGTILVQGIGRVMASHDQGASWKAAQSYWIAAHEPSSFDPWLAVDPVTDRVYSDHLTLACTSASWSDDAGATWTPYEPVACGTPITDFQKTVAGKPGPVANPLAGRNYPSVVTMCYNKVILIAGVFLPTGSPVQQYGLACAASYDGGATYQNEKLLSNIVLGPDGTALVPDCYGGAWGPAVAPDGTIVVRAQPDCMFRSRDSGLSWENLGKGPTFEGTQFAFDATGILYVLSSPEKGDLLLARSIDQGTTWSEPWSVKPPGVGSIAFQAMVAGDKGRVAVTFLANDTFYNDTHDAPETALWSPYMVVIEGAESDAPRVVSYDGAPLHRGCISREAPCPGLGDFVTMTAAPDGTPYVVFPAPCLEDCSKMAEVGAPVPGALVGLTGWSLKAPG